MSIIDRELKKIEELEAKAHAFLAAGEIAKAKRLIPKLERSFACTEADRVILLIRAWELKAAGDREVFKEFVLAHNYEVWGSAEMLELLRYGNPPISAETEEWHLCLRGGRASFGYMQFTHQHGFMSVVAADSLAEALTYIDELASFAAPTKRHIEHVERHPLGAGYVHKGVLFASPFTTEPINPQIATPYIS